MSMLSPIDNVRLFTFSDIRKVQECCRPSMAFKDLELLINDMKEHIEHLEAIISKTEDERDFYKDRLSDCI